MKPRLPQGLAAAFLLAAAPVVQAALDVAGLDRSADPCVDFYDFTNRKWLQSTEIPDDRARWGMFALVAERNERILVRAFDEALARPLPPAGTPQRKVIQYYASGMDEAAIASEGLAPLARLFERIDAVASPGALAAALGELHVHGIPAGFRFEVNADAKNSTRYLAQVHQDGLGLPDRDYYFLDDERSRTLRAAYRAHVARMLELAGAGAEAAASQADTVLALETELARASMTAVERRDPDKTYNRMTAAELAAQSPGFPWQQYFRAAGVAGLTELNVAQPEFFRALGRLAEERPAADWRTYLRWQALLAAAPVLPATFEREHFGFHHAQLQGVKTQPPRHRRVMRAIGGQYGHRGLGMAIGRVYVDQAFSPEAKTRALEMVNDVKAALAERLEAVDWMTEETRRRSLEKLEAMQIKIGYPDRWRDYGSADVGPYSFARNWLNANAFDHRRRVARIGKPVDRADWFMSPHVVNAYYNARGNEIVFPAAILQPPYFDIRADDAVNYGGIGMVIGHEITHGFDNRGRRFDKHGNLTDWWTPEDERRYNERAQRIERQYAAFEGVEGVKVNGTLTLGENLSDIGGLKIAYDALQRALRKKPQAPIDGLTPEQRFFVAFAQSWRERARSSWERNALLTGQHSLARFRVRGPLAHMPEFAEAFSCDAASTLLTDAERARIW